MSLKDESSKCEREACMLTIERSSEGREAVVRATVIVCLWAQPTSSDLSEGNLWEEARWF